MFYCKQGTVKLDLKSQLLQEKLFFLFFIFAFLLLSLPRIYAATLWTTNLCSLNQAATVYDLKQEIFAQTQIEPKAQYLSVDNVRCHRSVCLLGISDQFYPYRPTV